MDRITFGRKTSNGQRPRVDRFVAPRESIPEIRRRLLWSAEYTSDYALRQRRKKYMNLLDEAFNLEPLKVQEPMLDQGSEIGSRFTWPCVPRKKSILSSDNSVLLLDLPTYSDAAFPELLDWSDDNILVAALGTRYHMWSWKSQTLVRQGFTRNEIHCCKFDPRGGLLLLGTAGKRLEMHDSLHSKWISGNNCICDRIQPRYCHITTIDWSPTGNSYATGCSRGAVNSFCRASLEIMTRVITRASVLSVKVSPNARFVAAAAIDGDAVEVLTWPDLTVYSSLTIPNRTVKTLAWHPWRSALLGIGTAECRIGLWDVPSERMYFWIMTEFSILDSMLFSYKTGELVLSLWNEHTVADIPKAGSVLTVLGAPRKLVDQWGIENRTTIDRVRTMVFSPDGSQLATATAGEDLIIWNFLPEDKRKNEKSSRNYNTFSKLPVYLDEAHLGYSLR